MYRNVVHVIRLTGAWIVTHGPMLLKKARLSNRSWAPTTILSHRRPEKNLRLAECETEGSQCIVKHAFLCCRRNICYVGCSIWHSSKCTWIDRQCFDVSRKPQPIALDELWDGGIFRPRLTLGVAIMGRDTFIKENTDLGAGETGRLDSPEVILHKDALTAWCQKVV